MIRISEAKGCLKIQKKIGTQIDGKFNISSVDEIYKKISP
jgi:hypothetical protein